MSLSEDTLLEFVSLRAEHIPILLEIENEAYPDPWTEGMFRQEIHSNASYFYLAFHRDALIGYGGFWLVVDEAHITKVTITAPYRGMGHGKLLLRFLLEKAAQLGAHTIRLEVRESNEPARRLYTGLGFEEIGLRRGYYAQTNETAVVMSQSLVQD